MGRYLYKAKRIYDDQWVIGNMVIDEDGEKNIVEPAVIARDGHHLSINSDMPMFFFQESFCQCTGLEDETNQMIFEHDLVAFTDMHSTESGYAELDCVGEVLWDDETSSFYVTERLSAESYEILDGNCIVIGNTFDNQELI